MNRSNPERFWRKVDRRSNDECWPWTGAINTWGYGDCYYQGRRTNASRIALEIAMGAPAPDGAMVCHTCDNPRCCNPAHLFIGTAKDNMRDKMAKGRGRGMFKKGIDTRRIAQRHL